jgi:transposase, IS5 family
MRPRGRQETGEQDLFRSRLDQIIDLSHALVKLSRAIVFGGAVRIGLCGSKCRGRPSMGLKIENFTDDALLLARTRCG